MLDSTLDPAFLGQTRVIRRAATLLVTLGMLLSPSHHADAQASVPAANAWEFRVTTGGFVPTGALRANLKDAELSAAQLSYVVRPAFAITGTFGWARSRDIASPDDPKLDVFTYDIGAEARGAERLADRAVTFTPFIGAGAGGRSYNYRNLDVHATHNFAGYGTAGGELGMGRVGLRLEVRDYATGFKPLVGAGSAGARNDVVIMAAVRFDRHHSRPE